MEGQGQGAEAAVLVTGAAAGFVSSPWAGAAAQTIKPVLLGQDNISQEFVEQISNAIAPEERRLQQPQLTQQEQHWLSSH